MSVLEEILAWSQDRPAWQRDALRRLVLNGDLSEDDLRDLGEICKSAHGLAEQRESAPLAKGHVPGKGADSAHVTLVSIFHHRGVNALAEDQTLKFATRLTVVYGDNAAGKTGYIRILKSACRARGPQEILGNVVSGAAPPKPVVAITYKVGTEDKAREWSGDGGGELISRVSVFDTQCAAVYLTQKTDVAFRPFGLDLFDKLVKACKAVRTKLDGEQRALASAALASVQPQVPEGTAVAKLLVGLTSLTKPETVQALARLSGDEEARLALLEKSLLDLQANDPEKLARQLIVRAGRVRALAQHLRGLEAALSADAVAAVFATRAEGRRKREEAQRLRTATFPAGVLEGTGSEPWSVLWESARGAMLICGLSMSVLAPRMLMKLSRHVGDGSGTSSRGRASCHWQFCQSRDTKKDLWSRDSAPSTLVKRAHGRLRLRSQSDDCDYLNWPLSPATFKPQGRRCP